MTNSKVGTYEYFGAGQYKVFTGNDKNDYIVCDSMAEVKEEIELIKKEDKNDSKKSKNC